VVPAIAAIIWKRVNHPVRALDSIYFFRRAGCIVALSGTGKAISLSVSSLVVGQLRTKSLFRAAAAAVVTPSAFGEAVAIGGVFG
jgi:hypothetical protein